MTEKEAIGVCDLGASGGRFFLVYPDRKRLNCQEVYRFSHHHQTFFQTSVSGQRKCCRYCWDLGRLYDQLLEGIKRLSSVEGFRLTSFGIDTWGSDGAWMTDDGDVLGLVGTGRDARWQQAQNELIKTIDPRELFGITGVQSHPFNVVNQVYWYCKNEPKIVEAAAVYMPVHSLLYYYLTGQRVAEYTWLSTTQLCIAGRPEYAQAVFDRLSLPQSKMPPIAKPLQSLGPCLPSLAESLGIRPFNVTLPAVHDTACSYAVADCCIDSPTMVISTGTWFLAGAKLSAPLLSEKAFGLGFANEAGYDSVRFLKNVMGSWPAQQLRRLWSRRDNQEMSWTEFEKKVAQGAAFNCILDIDHPLFFDAENMEQAVTAYCIQTGQSAPKTPADTARAIYEGMALKVALIAEILGTARGIATEEILIVGGSANSAMLNQWFADASGLPVRTGPADATACGNAAFQAMSLGWIDSAAAAMNQQQEGLMFEHKPSMQWKESLEKLKELMHYETF